MKRFESCDGDISNLLIMLGTQFIVKQELTKVDGVKKYTIKLHARHGFKSRNARMEFSFFALDNASDVVLYKSDAFKFSKTGIKINKVSFQILDDRDTLMFLTIIEKIISDIFKSAKSSTLLLYTDLVGELIKELDATHSVKAIDTIQKAMRKLNKNMDGSVSVFDTLSLVKLLYLFERHDVIKEHDIKYELGIGNVGHNYNQVCLVPNDLSSYIYKDLIHIGSLQDVPNKSVLFNILKNAIKDSKITIKMIGSKMFVNDIRISKFTDTISITNTIIDLSNFTDCILEEIPREFVRICTNDDVVNSIKE